MNAPRLRIGVFGGAFNPIHHCHLTIARQTCERAPLDRVLFVPTGDPPHKALQSLAPAHHRLEMVRVAIASDPHFALSDIEVSRSTKSYSIDTVRLLRREFGTEVDLFFIVGLDAFLEVEGWKQASDLMRAIHFIVVSRPGLSFASLAHLSLLPSIESATLDAFDSSHFDRVDLPLTSMTRLILLRLPPCDISASDIRKRLATGQSVVNLLPDSVRSYILCHGLYREDADRSGNEN